MVGTHSELSFASAFKITNISLLINGAHPSIKRNFLWVAHYAAGMGITWFLNSFVLYSIWHSIKEGNLTEACRHGTLGIVAFLISFKYVILLVHQAETLDMMRAMERDYERARTLSAREQAVVRHYAARGAWVSKLWFAVAAATSMLFPLLAAFGMIRSATRGHFHKIMVFEFCVPIFEDIKYDNNIFIPLFIGTTVYAAYAATVYMAFDPLVPIFMLHCCGQLELVTIQIQQLFPEHGTRTWDAAATGARLRRVVVRLQEIYRFLETARSNFTIVYEMILKATTVLIPITLYQIVESIKINNPSLEFISFGFGCLVHFYVPCYYSDLMMKKSLSIVEAVYSCGWECHWDRAGTRRILAVMMIRANRPLAMTTAFDLISLDSFTEMCRQSYAIFQLMNASVE